MKGNTALLRPLYTNKFHITTKQKPTAIKRWVLPQLHSLRSGVFQCRHIDHEAVAHVAFFHALKTFVNLVDIEHFNIAGDVLFGAQLEQLFPPLRDA